MLKSILIILNHCQKNKELKLLTSLIFSYRLIVITLMIITVSGFEYRIQSINESSGIFFEHIGNAKLYSEKWKLVTYMNISFYSTKLNLIKSLFERSKPLCGENKAHVEIVNCIQTREFLQAQIPTLEQKQTTIFSLLNHKLSKRGIFNGGGTLLKWVFGTADSDDVAHIDDAIDKVEKDDEEILNLMKDQTHVFKTTISNFNDSLLSLKDHEKVLNKNIDQLNEYLRKDLDAKTRYMTAIKLLSHLNSLTYLVNELNEQYDVLTDAILFVRTNTIHPQIITPSQLIKELEPKIRTLEDGKGFPLPLDSDHAYKILELSKITCYYSGERLVFIIKIPITLPTVFNIYQTYPLPIIMSRSRSSYTYIEPSFPIILLSTNKMQYVQFNDFNGCSKITNDDYICESHLVYSTLEKPSCETSLLTTVSTLIPKMCKTAVLYGTLHIWHPLKFNQWIFVTSEEDRLTVICKQTPVKDDIIRDIGILTLSSECTAYSKLTKLLPQHITTSEYHNIIPNVRIVDNDCCDKDNNETEETIQLTKIHLTNIRLDDLRQASHQLSRFEEEIDTLKNNHKTIHRKTNYFYLLLKIIGAILAIGIIYRILKFFGICKLLSLLIPDSCKCSHNGCCIKIYNQCTQNPDEQTQRPLPPLPIMQFSELQRNENIYVDPDTLRAIQPRQKSETRAISREPSCDSVNRRPTPRRSYHGISLDD